MDQYSLRTEESLTDMSKDSLPCWIYKSPRKDEMYLYSSLEDDFSAIPEPLLNRFGKPIFVMQLNLAETPKLARVDLEEVCKHLEKDGYFLQMPPNLTPDIYHGNAL